MKQLYLKLNRRGQATTELAILGIILIMGLAYLLSQGYLYNSRQALEMYTFRKALQLSQKENRGITLTVIRDVIAPSFFTALNRQRLMATSSVEYNPWKIWLSYDREEEVEAPQHVPSLQLLQINEAMIRNNYFFQVPPTRVVIKTKDAEEKEPRWVSSAIFEIDPQTKPVKITQRELAYNYQTRASEDSWGKTMEKSLRTQDRIPTAITFENAERIRDNYFREDWEGIYEFVEVDGTTIPKGINLVLDEIIEREKNVYTPH